MFGPTVENTSRPAGVAPQGMVWIPGGEFSMGAADPMGPTTRIEHVEDADRRPFDDRECRRQLAVRGPTEPSITLDDLGPGILAHRPSGSHNDKRRSGKPGPPLPILESCF
jgi:hypothetical protein